MLRGKFQQNGMTLGSPAAMASATVKGTIDANAAVRKNRAPPPAGGLNATVRRPESQEAFDIAVAPVRENTPPLVLP